MILQDPNFKYGPYSAMEVKIFFEILPPPEPNTRAIFEIMTAPDMPRFLEIWKMYLVFSKVGGKI